jgi:hypothetical protein
MFLHMPTAARREVEKDVAMPHEIRIGDYVIFLENRPAPDILSVGLIGEVVDPGHTAPSAS